MLRSTRWRSLGVAVALVLGTLTAFPVPGAAATGRTWYVDCAAGDDRDAGTSQDDAWRTLAKASKAVYRPGDRLLLRRDTECTGTLAPRGSGTADLPITVASYGRGAKPKIAANGALAAVLLRNVEGWEIRDLDLSNQGPPPQPAEIRFGVYVLLTDFGIGHHYVVANVDVHHVNGCECQNPHQTDPSGGIGFKAAGATTPTGFADVLVQGNTLTAVDRQGIVTSSDWERRAEYPAGRGTSFVPMTGVVVRGNTLTDIGGDGIAIFNGAKALVARNVVRDFSQRATHFSAGMYAYNSNDTRFRFNDVASRPGSLPAQPYYFESANIGTIFEYNFSRGNSGGTLGLCNDPGDTFQGNVFRYNISQDDDGRGSYPWGAPIALVNEFACGTIGETAVYGNTFYSTVAEHLVTDDGVPGMKFTDNIFAGRPAGSIIDGATDQFDHNLYHRVIDVPADPHPVVGDPLLRAPGAATSRDTASGYQLRTGSPALGAGTSVPGNGGRDFFGNPIPAQSPNIGAYTGPGVG
ncbi:MULTISPECIES: right-handed parallel beta-helix repeat-containing protein [Amycolatopsis]|uniref:right-handed parallel beta-helix repeat-containing protein n=1 Tax=Amycolatopsis TaxID=1813 RepID=UPI000B8B2EDE|nr:MULTISPECIES: right-handed parallel beta-helix repeat-containing protein [Amycolatopsis]OXM61988.1 hypothetical protein CF166_33080 [Amycolatopsis sp. KNN50.9b]